MLGVVFCWRSFRSMAVSIPKAAEIGGRIVSLQVIDLKHCVCHGAISGLRWASARVSLAGRPVSHEQHSTSEGTQLQKIVLVPNELI
jgi:hypothetical protein